MDLSEIIVMYSFVFLVFVVLLAQPAKERSTRTAPHLELFLLSLIPAGGRVVVGSVESYGREAYPSGVAILSGLCPFIPTGMSPTEEDRECSYS